MTGVDPVWLAEVRRRIAIDEGERLSRYFDTLGIPTIGIGFNLQRSDAQDALRLCGCGNPTAVMRGDSPLTDAQAASLFSYSFAPILSQARGSVTHFDVLSPARQFVLCDLNFNLGGEGWLAFGGTRQLIDAATVAKLATLAHDLYSHAADHLEASAWYSQTGNRAKRNVAMMRSSTWCDPAGDGT